MSKPAVGKQVKRTVQTSGNRHQAGAMRISIALDIRLTCEPEEAEALAAVLTQTVSETELPPELLELLHSLRAIDPKLTKPAKGFADALKSSAYKAKLSNWLWHRDRGIDYPKPESEEYGVF